jgi:hypothetical protein
MSKEVEIEYGDSAQDTAVLLLAAAEELGEEPAVVRTGSGIFYAPEEVAKKAGVKHQNVTPVGQPRVSEDQPAQEGDGSNAPKQSESQPAKKAAAKKAPAKKATAKKSAAKKSTAKKS